MHSSIEEKYNELQRQSHLRASAANDMSQIHLGEERRSAVPKPTYTREKFSMSRQHHHHEPRPAASRANKPEPHWTNLFGVIDTQKLRSLCGGAGEEEFSTDDHMLGPMPPNLSTENQGGNAVAPSSDNPYKTHSKYYTCTPKQQVRLAHLATQGR